MKKTVLALSLVTLVLPPALPAGGAPPAPLSKKDERAKFNPDEKGMDGRTRLAGHDRRVALEKASLLRGLTFRNVGPEIQGGRIVDIEGPSGRPDTLFLAFASGGLFRTDDKGGTFTSLFDDESSITIGDIALGDAEGKVIWVGSGEANSSRTSYAGTGVFKSTDGGKSWKNTGLPDSHHIGKVIVDAKNPDIVFVASLGPLYTAGGERGVFRTTDGGGSWRRVLYTDDRTGAVDLVQDPADPRILYAAMWERDRKAWNFLESGKGSGIFKSTDGGDSWNRLTGGFPQGDTVGRIGLALAPSSPGTVYAVLDNQARRPDSEPPDEDTPPGELTVRRLKKLTKEQFLALDAKVVDRFLRRNDFPVDLKAKDLFKDVKKGKVTLEKIVGYIADANRDLFENDIVSCEVYRTSDAGATWKRTHETRLDQVTYSYGYYFGKIWAAPDDANRVYVAGVPLIVSTDGGRTWTGLAARDVHVDHHAFFFEAGASRRVALGNDGGLNLSWNGGETWTKVNGFPVGQFTTIAVDDAEPYNIIGGLQDNGTLRGPSTYRRGPSDAGAWKAIGGGDGSMVQIDPKDRNLVYIAYQFGFATRLDLKSQARKRVRPRPTLDEKPLRYNWVTPFLISPHSREILYFGANRLYRSFDRGETFTPISADLTSNREQGDVPFGTITSIAESPKTFGVLYCGTDEGKLWMSKDAGTTWKDVSQGLALDRWVTRVVASAHDAATVYVTQSGYRNDDFAPYVFRSTDFGGTWASLAAGLPDEPVNVVREDAKADHLLYLGTDLGAYASLDKGTSWMALSGGLPNVPVHDLAVQGKTGDVVLGTHGRSVFVAQAAPLRKLKAEAIAKDLVAFKVKAVEWDRNRGYGENPWFTWSRVPDTTRIAWYAGEGATGVAKISIRDAGGNVWKELTATSIRGVNELDYDLSADPAKAAAAEAQKAKKDAAKPKTAKTDKSPAQPEPQQARREEGDDRPDAERGSEALDARGREPEEDERGQQNDHVRVDDRRDPLAVALGDR